LSLFLSGFGQLAFYVVLGLFFASGLTVLIHRRNAPPVKAKYHNPYAVLHGLAIPGSMICALLFGYTGTGVLPDWSYYLGLTLSILGLAVMTWGFQTLGRYWAGEVVIYKGHQLMEKGPYRFMRHPIYSGLFLWLIGIGLAAQSWVGAVIIFIVLAMVTPSRIAFEEKGLISEFGERYISYSRRVKRLIPFIY